MKFFKPITFGLMAAMLGLTMAGCLHPDIRDQKPSQITNPETAIITGSHIRRPVDPKTKQPKTAWPLRSYSQKELQQTGQADTARALQRLCPALQVSGPASLRP